MYVNGRPDSNISAIALAARLRAGVEVWDAMVSSYVLIMNDG